MSVRTPHPVTPCLFPFQAVIPELVCVFCCCVLVRAGDMGQ